LPYSVPVRRRTQVWSRPISHLSPEMLLSVSSVGQPFLVGEALQVGNKESSPYRQVHNDTVVFNILLITYQRLASRLWPDSPIAVFFPLALTSGLLSPARSRHS